MIISASEGAAQVAPSKRGIPGRGKGRSEGIEEESAQ